MTAKNPTHQSVSIQAGLDEMGWSINEFADELGISRDTIEPLMHAQCAVSPIVALALERIGWSDAEFWMRRQANYDLTKARRELEARTA